MNYYSITMDICTRQGYKKRMEIRRFVIPDIHGCALTFHHLIHQVLQIRKTDRVYLLGDLIDRGPRSKQVLDMVMELRARGFSFFCLRGNHEQMLLDAYHSPQAIQTWILNGGYATLDSFGISKVADIPRRYRDLCEDFSLYYEMEDYILVHAGMNFDEGNPFSDTQAMLWKRTPSMDKTQTANRKLICGHTPHTRSTVRASLATDIITLDNGCVYRETGMGALTALELNSLELIFQENID